MVQAVDECVTAQTGVDMGLLTPEESFCDSELGYAGKCDLHGHGWVIDFKSKDADAMGKARGWPEQAEQLVAYANGLDTPNARLANVFISRSPPEDGEPWAVKWFEHNDEWAWARFLATLNLWQTVNKFGPAFEALQEQAA
jgi:hypothetical protein